MANPFLMNPLAPEEKTNPMLAPQQIIGQPAPQVNPTLNPNLAQQSMLGNQGPETPAPQPAAPLAQPAPQPQGRTPEEYAQEMLNIDPAILKRVPGIGNITIGQAPIVSQEGIQYQPSYNRPLMSPGTVERSDLNVRPDGTYTSQATPFQVLGEGLADALDAIRTEKMSSDEYRAKQAKAQMQTEQAQAAQAEQAKAAQAAQAALAGAGQGTVLAEPTAPQFTIPNLPLNTQPIGSLTSDQLTDLLKVTEQPQPSRLGTVTLPTGEVRNVEASFTLPSGEVRQIIEGQSIPQAFGRPDDGMKTFQVDGGQVSVPMDQAVQTLDLGEAARAREAQQRFLASPESAEMSSRMLSAYSDPMAQASAAREARLAARPDFMQAQPTVRSASDSSLTMEQATRLSGGDKGIAQRIAELSKMGRDPLTGELPKQKTEQEKQLEEARLKLIEAQTETAQREEPAPDPEAERIARETAQARLNLLNQQVEAAGKKDPDKLARVTAEADRLISAKPPILPAESRQAYILSQMGIDVDEILGSGLTPTAPTGGSNAAEPKDHKSANDAAKAAGQDTYTFQGKKYKVQ